MADRGGPLRSQFNQSRETMRMMFVRLRWPARRRSCRGEAPGALPDRVLRSGPADARLGRDGVDMQGAAPVHSAFVADDPQRGKLALREPSGAVPWFESYADKDWITDVAA
jgi:hypothetical protein